MFIDNTYKRRVRIEGKPDEMNGYKLTVHDLDTGEQIMNVMGAAIYLAPGELNAADLHYYQFNEQGKMMREPLKNFEPVVGTVRVHNPWISISAYEREEDVNDDLPG